MEQVMELQKKQMEQWSNHVELHFFGWDSADKQIYSG